MLEGKTQTEERAGETNPGESPELKEIEEAEQFGQYEKKGRSRGFLSGLLLGLVIGALLLCTVFFGRNLYYLVKLKMQTSVGSDSTEKSDRTSVVSTDTLQKIKTIEEAIEEYFYGEEISTSELQDGIYKGMVEALGDPYSEYYSTEELTDALDSNQGISYGIGAYISLNQQMDMAMISGVMEDTPAEEAGLREGDIIYQVDGESTQGLSITQVVSMVKGQENTTVHLTVYREGEPDYLELDIERRKQIETETIQSGMLEDTNQIGYLRIREFDGVTVDQFNEAMAELNASEMKGLILDLRSNPGGDLTAVTEVARRILPKGLIVYTEDKEGVRTEYSCKGEHELKIPLVVLVNQFSASASEILAGAIKDYNKGTIIGTTTYGKGIVQRIHRLEDGTAIKLTVSAYFTPNGKNIHGIGIEPDIELEYDYDAYERDGTDNQVEKAIEILTEQIG